jgi:hypothetical protein
MLRVLCPIFHGRTAVRYSTDSHFTTIDDPTLGAGAVSFNVRYPVAEARARQSLAPDLWVLLDMFVDADESALNRHNRDKHIASVALSVSEGSRISSSCCGSAPG